MSYGDNQCKNVNDDDGYDDYSDIKKSEYVNAADDHDDDSDIEKGENVNADDDG